MVGAGGFRPGSGRPVGTKRPLDIRVEIELKEAALEVAKRVRAGEHDQNDTVFIKAYMERMKPVPVPGHAGSAPVGLPTFSFMTPRDDEVHVDA
jgi:hypothetical protein